MNFLSERSLRKFESVSDTGNLRWAISSSLKSVRQGEIKAYIIWYRGSTASRLPK
jgi:hypothetical protein